MPQTITMLPELYPLGGGGNNLGLLQCRICNEPFRPFLITNNYGIVTLTILLATLGGSRV